MSLRNIVRSIIPALGVLLLGLFGMTTHAVPSSAHGSHGSVRQDPVTSCASLCLSIPSRDEDNAVLFEDEDDDTQERSHYSLLTIGIAYSSVHDFKTLQAVDFEPPPGVPSYLLYSVLRF